jgi:hypothetical protein
MRVNRGLAIERRRGGNIDAVMGLDIGPLALDAVSPGKPRSMVVFV